MKRIPLILVLMLVPYLLVAQVIVSSTQSPMLTWTRLGSVTTYRIQVSKDSLFRTTAVDQSNIRRTSYRAYRLQPATKYYWRVSAATAGINTWSGVLSFTTTSKDNSRKTLAQIAALVTQSEAIIDSLRIVTDSMYYLIEDMKTYSWFVVHPEEPMWAMTFMPYVKKGLGDSVSGVSIMPQDSVISLINKFKDKISYDSAWHANTYTRYQEERIVDSLWKKQGTNTYLENKWGFVFYPIFRSAVVADSNEVVMLEQRMLNAQVVIVSLTSLLDGLDTLAIWARDLWKP